MELLRPQQFCDTCNSYMELKTCSPRRFNDGYCWSCPQAEHFRSVRHGSILHNRKISLSNFLHLLWLFCNRSTACDAARILSMHSKHVRSLYRTQRQCMAEDLIQNGARGRIGGDGHIRDCAGTVHRPCRECAGTDRAETVYQVFIVQGPCRDRAWSVLLLLHGPCRDRA